MPNTLNHVHISIVRSHRHSTVYIPNLGHPQSTPCKPATRRGAKYSSFNSATSYHCNAVLLTWLAQSASIDARIEAFSQLASHSTTLSLSVDHWVQLTTRHNLASFFLLATQYHVYLSSKCTVTSQRQCRAPPLLVVADRGNGHERDA